MIISVTDSPYSADPTGVIDATAAINAAELCVSAAGGGMLLFPPGTYTTTGLTKRSGTIWQGCGQGISTTKLAPGTATNAVVSGLNAYSLFGTNSLSGIVDWAIRDLTIDGNRTYGTTSDGLGVYGWIYNLDNVEIKSCNGRGWRSEYGTPGVEKHFNAQSHASNMLIWDNQLDGVYFCGPTDSTFYGLNVYWNLRYGIHLAGQGTIKATDCHVWSDQIGGRQCAVGWRIDSAINTLTSCVSEGSYAIQTWLRSTRNTIIGGETFYNQVSPNAVTGIRLGDSTGIGGAICVTGDNTILTRVDNCQASAILFDNDYGHNRIDVAGLNNGGGTGYSGIIGPASRVRMDIAGALAAAVLNRDYIPLVLV